MHRHWVQEATWHMTHIIQRKALIGTGKCVMEIFAVYKQKWCWLSALRRSTSLAVDVCLSMPRSIGFLDLSLDLCWTNIFAAVITGCLASCLHVANGIFPQWQLNTKGQPGTLRDETNAKYLCPFSGKCNNNKPQNRDLQKTRFFFNPGVLDDLLFAPIVRQCEFNVETKSRLNYGQGLESLLVNLNRHCGYMFKYRRDLWPMWGLNKPQCEPMRGAYNLIIYPNAAYARALGRLSCTCTCVCVHACVCVRCMCVCMRVYTVVYMRVCVRCVLVRVSVCVRARACVHALCMCVRVYTVVYVRVCVRCVFVCVCARTRVCVHVCMRVRVCVCMWRGLMCSSSWCPSSMRGPGSKLFVHHWGLEGRLRGFPGLSPFMLKLNFNPNASFARPLSLQYFMLQTHRKGVRNVCSTWWYTISTVCTVYDHTFDDSPAKNSVCTPYKHGSGQPYACVYVGLHVLVKCITYIYKGIETPQI
jgi:hypothetical protein